jgi:hypothetical protein
VAVQGRDKVDLGDYVATQSHTHGGIFGGSRLAVMSAYDPFSFRCHLCVAFGTSPQELGVHESLTIDVILS